MHCRHFATMLFQVYLHKHTMNPTPPKGIHYNILVGLICLIITWSLASNFKGSAFNRTHSNSQPIVWRCIRPSFIGGSGLRLSTGFQGLDQPNWFPPSWDVDHLPSFNFVYCCLVYLNFLVLFSKFPLRYFFKECPSLYNYRSEAF